MDNVVIFNYSVWSLRYPELAIWVTEALAELYFQEATLYLNNTPVSPVIDGTPNGKRAMLLNMLTAHIAALNAALNGQAPSNLVGRIGNATEGSVSLQIENNYAAGTPQWYQQTKYGSAFWAATAQYRTARYIASPARPADPWAVILGYGGYGGYN